MVVLMDFKAQIEKLELPRNWCRWKRQMELLLRHHGVLDVVTGKKVAPKILSVEASVEDVQKHEEEAKCYEKDETFAQLILVRSLNGGLYELVCPLKGSGQ
uniref:Uncharacterized protein n=1 Tax=Trichuris muris TaxID=70415 RepID=A0A5S6Q508_TRIMR